MPVKHSTCGADHFFSPISNRVRRRVRLWSALLELAWDPSTQEHGGRKHDAGVQGSGAVQADKKKSSRSNVNSSKRDLGLARRAAVAVLDGGRWDPQKNRELVVMQVTRFASGCLTYDREVSPFFDMGSVVGMAISNPLFGIENIY